MSWILIDLLRQSKRQLVSLNRVTQLQYRCVNNSGSTMTSWIVTRSAPVPPRSFVQLQNQGQPFTIVVEGNIGSGKTTLLQHFKKFNDKIAVLDEPVMKWRDVHGHNLLDLMYKDPVKWSLCFQSYVQMTMLDVHTQVVEQPIKLMERSIFSAKYCFTNNLREQGFMKDVEHIVLSEWFNFIRKEIPLRVDLIVYLRTDPEVVYDRICKRGRSEENAISLDYLKSIHNLHEDWLIHKKNFVPAPVVTYDANEDLNIMSKNYSLCEDAIFQKIPVAN